MRVDGGRSASLGGFMQSLNEMPDPTAEDLRAIEMDELDADLARALDAKRSAIPLKAKRRDAPAGIQRLDSLYKDPANWTPWSNVTLVHKAEVDTILGFFISYRHATVIGARKLVRSPTDPLLGHEVEYVTDPWYLHNSEERHRAEPSTQLHFTLAMRIVLDDGLASEGEHVVHVGATRGVGIRRAVLDTAVRLSGLRVILYLPAGLDIIDGLAKECKMKLKEAFDGQS